MSEQYSQSTRPLTAEEVDFVTFLLDAANIHVPITSEYLVSGGNEYLLISGQTRANMRKIISAKYFDPRDGNVAFIDLLSSGDSEAFEVSIWKPKHSDDGITIPQASIIDLCEDH